MKKKDIHNSRVRIFSATICFLSIFIIAGLAAGTERASLRAEKDTGEVKLEFSLEMTQVDSQTIRQLDFSLSSENAYQQFESQPFVLSETSSAPEPDQIIQTSPSTSKFEHSLYTASLITLTALNVADYFTTVRALNHKELEEANPAMKPITKNAYLFTAVKLGVAALDIYILKNLYKKNKPLAWIISAAANFAMSYVVASNVKMIRDVR